MSPVYRTRSMVIYILFEQKANRCSKNRLTIPNKRSIIIIVTKQYAAKRFKRCANTFLLDCIVHNKPRHSLSWSLDCIFTYFYEKVKFYQAHPLCFTISQLNIKKKKEGFHYEFLLIL